MLPLEIKSGKVQKDRKPSPTTGYIIKDHNCMKIKNKHGNEKKLRCTTSQAK